MRKRIKELNKNNNNNVLEDFLKEFSKDGLKNLLMKGSKELIPIVLSLLPFGGPVKTAFDVLGNIIKES